MIFTTEHPEIKVIIPEKYQDGRGWFSELYSRDHMAEFFPNGVQQISQSLSHLNVLRGLHLQYGMDKQMRVVKGGILLVCVDMNPDSDFYLQHYRFVLSEQLGRCVFAPSHIARGFYTLQNDTVVEYYHSSTYDPCETFTIAYNDPELDILWPSDDPILSEKDKHGLSVKEFRSLTEWS